MGDALDEFRFPTLVDGMDLKLVTGQPSQFGQTDQEGNIAFFNKLQVGDLVAATFNGPNGAPNILPSSIQGKIAQATVAAQSVPSGVQTPGNFTTGNYPNPPFFVAQGTTGIKAVVAGLIIVCAYVNWSGAAGGVQRIANLLANAGVAALVNGSPISASFPATGNVSYLLNLSANDVISLSFFQDSGSPLNVNSANLICAYLGNLL